MWWIIPIVAFVCCILSGIIGFLWGCFFGKTFDIRITNKKIRNINKERLKEQRKNELLSQDN